MVPPNTQPSRPARSSNRALPPDPVASTGFTLPDRLPVAAGADRIDFSINPASIKVVGLEPAFALKVTQTMTGIELRWPSLTGTNYRLEEGDVLAGREPYRTYSGTGAEIVVELEPFTNHPRQHFYRVVKVE